MTKEEYEVLKEINREHATEIENRISDGYKQSVRANIADGFSSFLFVLGYIIFITLFQNMITLGNSGKRKYSWNWLIALSGLNILSFLYIGEQSRFEKYRKKELEKAELPEFFEEYRKGYERVKNLTQKQLDSFKAKNIFTVEQIPNKNFVPLGFVFGSSIRSKNATTDIGQFFKRVRGGKLRAYKALMDDTRSNAIDALIKNAVRKYENFDAICNIRFATSDVSSGASEILIYGTVIKFI